MMKSLIISILFFSYFHSFGQKALEDIKILKGVWIAEEYYNSFEKSKSAVQSKNSFYHGYPVALRVNPIEIKNGVLNIGYSVLHDHRLHPEVSEYIVINNDTIREQASFKIDLENKDSLGYFKTSEISYFNENSASYIKWNTATGSITLFRPKNDNQEEEQIRYKRISSGFKKGYEFPNPLYYYTRLRTLVGDFILKDSAGNVLSEHLKIKEDGKINGYQGFENLTAYFITDIYCGPTPSNDSIILDENVLDQEGKTFLFFYKKTKSGNIYLYKEGIWKYEHGKDVSVLGSIAYELIKN